MKTKHKILLVLLSLSLIASLYVVQSYALWSYTAPQTTTNSVSSGCFNIQYSETSGSNLSLTKSYPISDADAIKKETNPYTFTITNKCTINTAYTVTLNVMKGSNLSTSFIKYALVSGTTTPTGKFLSKAPTNTDTTNYENSANILNSYKVATGVLANNGAHTFKLYLWIDESATTAIAGQKFEAAVYVNNVPTTSAASGPIMSQ